VHVRRYNSPTIDGVAIAMATEEFHPYDFVLQRGNEKGIADIPRY